MCTSSFSAPLPQRIQQPLVDFPISVLPSLLFGFRTSSLKMQQTRNYHNSSTLRNKALTHVDSHGKAKMVDVSSKGVTARMAQAQATVYIGPVITKLIHENNIAKGDVLTIAQLAGIMGAKRTADIIPLCHNIPLSSVDVRAELAKKEECVVILATVRCQGKTGVEMEALTAASVAALTVYDMCKAVSHDIIIRDVMLIEKSGGKTKFKRLEDDGFTLNYNKEPMDLKEPFYPLHH